MGRIRMVTWDQNEWDNAVSADGQKQRLERFEFELRIGINSNWIRIRTFTGSCSFLARAHSCTGSPIPVQIRGFLQRFADSCKDSRILAQIHGFLQRFIGFGSYSRILVQIRGFWYRFVDYDSRIQIHGCLYRFVDSDLRILAQIHGFWFTDSGWDSLMDSWMKIRSSVRKFMELRTPRDC